MNNLELGYAAFVAGIFVYHWMNRPWRKMARLNRTVVTDIRLGKLGNETPRDL